MQTVKHRLEYLKNAPDPRIIAEICRHQKRNNDYSGWYSSVIRLWEGQYWPFLRDAISGSPAQWVSRLYPQSATGMDAWYLASFILDFLFPETWHKILNKHSKEQLVCAALCLGLPGYETEIQNLISLGTLQYLEDGNITLRKRLPVPKLSLFR